MKIIRQKDSAGKDMPGRYLVIVPSLFGDAILFGPASFAACNHFVAEKLKELGESLNAQIRAEQARLDKEAEAGRSRGMDGP